MPFEHILVPVDGSETSYAAVDKAVEIAKAFNSKVTVVQVLALDPISLRNISLLHKPMT